MGQKLEGLERFVQLHQSVEIIYVVDGYEAHYLVADGEHLEREAQGETIQEALQKLLASLVESPPEWGGPKALYCPTCRKLYCEHRKEK